MIRGSGGSKSRLAKAAGAEPAGQMRDEKLHAVVARSTFRSQNVQNTPFSDHFWKLRCRKSVRRCGAKHISKSKCAKHLSFGALLEFEMLKKCTPLWREAHLEVNMYKTHYYYYYCYYYDNYYPLQAPLFKPPLQAPPFKPPPSSPPFKPPLQAPFKPPSSPLQALRCRKSARRCGAKHISKSKC